MNSKTRIVTSERIELIKLRVLIFSNLLNYRFT